MLTATRTQTQDTPDALRPIRLASHVCITPIQKLTQALENGYQPSTDEVISLLYALQAVVVADESVMLWLNNTPESLADEMVKAQGNAK